MRDAQSIPGIGATLRRVVGHNMCALARNLALAFGVLVMAAAPARAAGLLDGDEDFKLLAKLGFEQAVDGLHPEGSQLNQYAWSMAWFKGKLYVGTARFQNDGSVASLQTMFGQIWAYTPGGTDGSAGTWALAFQSPMNLVGPREFGYRWMTVCTINGTEYMFVSTAGVLQGNILRTADGRTYTPMSRAGYPNGTVGFRTTACFTEASGKKLLITTPVGKGGDSTTYDTDLSDNPIVLANEDPGGNGSWRNYSPMRMNDAGIDALFTLYAAGGSLYAGADNPVSGGQLWRTTGCPNARVQCTPTWTKVVDRGGGRTLDEDGVARNYGISDIMAFGNAIYFGLASPTHRKPPAEMLRLRADGMFEVVVGEPRLNFGTDPNAPPTNPAYPANLRCGVPLEDLDGIGGANDCPPASRRGPGFGPVGSAATGYPDGSHSYFWRIHNYAHNATTAPLGDNRLYAGTLQGRRGTIESPPGFDVVVSANGTDWATLIDDGLAVPNSMGMRTIATTPYGLAIGSANRAAVGDDGGCAVWLGIPGADNEAPVTVIGGAPAPGEGSTIAVRSASFSWSGTDTPAPGSLPLTYASRLDPLEPGFSPFGAATAKSYTNLQNGTYTFHVIAKDAAGNTETPGAAPGAGNRRTFTVDAPDLPPTVTIQTKPTNPVPSGNITFTWTGSDDVTPPAGLGYDFWLEPLQSDPLTFVAQTSASYVNVAPGTYTFHVKAKDGANNVSPEATYTFVVSAVPQVPASPAPASAALLSPGVVRVSWPDVAGETTYDVQRCVVLKGACSFAPLASGRPANSTSFDDAIPGALRPNTFRYRVAACNPSGCSAWAASSGVLVP